MLWLCYQNGGTLPAAYREWVLHDGTCRTWLLRVVLRGLVQFAPVLAGLVIILRVWWAGRGRWCWGRSCSVCWSSCASC